MSKPKPSDMVLFGIPEVISQSTSKRLPQIAPVLEYIRKNKMFSATQLEKSLKVSRDSIDRTLKMLIQKEIIEIKEIRSRGEKFYKIKSESKLESLYDKLRKWWIVKAALQNKPQKTAAKYTKMLTRNSKIAKHSSRILSELDQKKQLWFISKQRQQQITKIPYPQPVVIWEMPMSETSKLVKNFENGLLCETCFQENKISYLVLDSDEEICEAGHAMVLQSTEEYSPHSQFLTRKKSKSITDYELEAQKNEYLLGKKRRSRTEDD